MWWVPLVVPAIGFAVWGLRVYYLRLQAKAVEVERQAGADAYEKEATDEESKRVTAAADAAGRAFGGVSDGPDPFDEAGK